MLLAQFARGGILAIGNNLSKVIQALCGRAGTFELMLFSLHHPMCMHTLGLAEAAVMARFMGALCPGALPAENTQPCLSWPFPLWPHRGGLLSGLSLAPCLCLSLWVGCDFLAAFVLPQHPMPTSAAVMGLSQPTLPL